MTFCAGSDFASVGAAGSDWRDVSRQVLEKLAATRAEKDGHTIGFLYMTDGLADDATSILNLFRSVTGIEHWVGCVGLGVCVNGKAFIDEPAIAAMTARIDPVDFCVFPPADIDATDAEDALARWERKNEPVLCLAHADPMSEADPGHILEQMVQITGAFHVGGLSSSRGQHIQIADEVVSGGLSGVVFSQNVPVVTALTQGCAPMGPAHTITRCDDDHTIMELDNLRAFEMFTRDVKALTASKTGRNPDQVELEGDALTNPEKIPQEFRSLFRGEVHVAFPVPGTDQGDYMVRAIAGIDPETGHIMVSQPVSSGDRVLFVHRDENTVQADLSRMLLDLRKRVIRDHGRFEPKGAIYVSCVGRAVAAGGARRDSDEMALIREIIGDVPMVGFYASGEISNNRLYGYTGVLTLFL